MTETHRLQHRQDLCSSNGILTTALIPACRGRRPAVILYLKPCISNSSTWPPRGLHEWGQQRGPQDRDLKQCVQPRHQGEAPTTGKGRHSPGTGLLRLNSQESSSLPLAGCRVQQLLLFRFNVGFIPCTLVLFH